MGNITSHVNDLGGVVTDKQGELFAHGQPHGEHRPTGAPIREYVWLGDIPVAVIEAGTTPTISYIHPDHLNRPIAMTDDTGAFVNETTWVAFGGIHVMTGSTGLDMRFPGQWYQHEGGLHYNWHRSYDPTIARYTQPDPLGLVDGPSRYAYVGSDPLQKVDPEGRFFWIVAGAVAGLALEYAADQIEQNSVRRGASIMVDDDQDQLPNIVLSIFQKKFNAPHANLDDEWGRTFGCHDEDVVDIIMEIERVTGLAVDESVTTYNELAKKTPKDVIRWIRRLPGRPGITARTLASLLSKPSE